jgi:hypothetical protein
LSGKNQFREKFLRHVWSRQYLRAHELVASDGRPIEVLSPGTLNEGSGPDFRDARVRIGPVLYSGDVEIHRHVSEWLQHGHQTDPAYNRVILHVVFTGDPLKFPTIVLSGRSVPVLLASDFLSDSLQNVLWKSMAVEEKQGRGTIPCAAYNAVVHHHVLEQWIAHLATERLELKIRRFEERLRDLAFRDKRWILENTTRYGSSLEENSDEIPAPELTHRDFAVRAYWDQILYEGIMDGLGYSRNGKPFVTLARSATLGVLRSLDVLRNPLGIEAVLLGVAGLLPDVSSLRETQSRTRVGILEGHWKILRSRVPCDRLSASDWVRSPVRPANAPVFRIAAAARIIPLVANGDFFPILVQSFRSATSVEDLLRDLVPRFFVTGDAFWTQHFDFDVLSTRPMKLLGRLRAMDIIANTCIPLVLLYARLFHDSELGKKALAIYHNFPPLTENTILRLMNRLLLGSRVPLTTMRLQQGAIQLYQNYCLEARCKECAIGKIVFKP